MDFSNIFLTHKINYYIIITGDIMNENLVISKIYGVYEGEFNNGFIPHKSRGRHSDCFVYFIEGDIEYTFDSYTLHTGKDGLIYLAEGSIYSINIKKPCKHIYVDFRFENNDKKSCVFKNISPSVKSEFIKLFYTWNKKQNAVFQKMMIQSILTQLFIQEKRKR